MSGLRPSSPYINRFLQPDSIIPSVANPQSWNRYSYVGNNPIGYADPTGHERTKEEGEGSCTERLKKSNPPCPKGTKDRRDLSDWMPRVLEDSVAHPGIQKIVELHKQYRPGRYAENDKNTIEANDIFISLVADGQYFDVKDNIEAELGTQQVKLGGYWYDYSAPGNILYGFYGAAARFSLPTLHAGASKAQLEDRFVNDPEHSKLGPPWLLFDTGDDYYAINFGYTLYTDYYLPDGNLTEAEFATALDGYKHRRKMAVTPPGGCLKAIDQYPTDKFYNK